MLGSLALASLLAAPAASPPPADHRWEVTLDAGASLLSVDDTGESQRDIDLPAFAPGLPTGAVRTLLSGNLRLRTQVGGSMLEGFQVSRRVGSRGWIETGLQIAPMHTRRRSVSFACPAEVCALLGISSLDDALATEDRVVAYHYGLGFAYELARGDVRPFLSAGIGAVTYDIPDETNTDLAFDVGAGVRLGISERVGARLEVIDRIVVDHFLSGGTEHDVHVRAGVTFRLP